MDSNSIKQHQWLRRAAWVAGSVALVWATAWALVPPLLKRQLQKIASEALGRQVTVGSIDFKPWTLELVLADLSIARAGADNGAATVGQTPQLQIKRIYVNAELQSLIRLAPVVDAVAVDGLSLALTHLGDGKYDVDDILARLNKPSDKPPSGSPHFAIFNIALNGGTLDFIDKSVGAIHELRDLTLTIPFLSNLESDREVKTSPRLAFKINGSRFDSSAEATPFAQTRKTDATIRLAGFNLKPYLGYLPASLPVRLTSAVLDADVKVGFEQTGKTVIKVSGAVVASGVKLTDTHAQDLLSFDALKIALEDVRPLEQTVKISAVDLSNPQLDITRDKAGQLNLIPAATSPGTPSAPEKVANNAIPAGTSATSDTQKAVWKLEVAKVAVLGGSVNFRDGSTTPKAQVALRSVALEAQAIAWPFQQPLQIAGSAALLAQGDSGTGASLSFKGSASDQAANVDVTVTDVPLVLASPYLAQFLAPSLKGALSAQVAVDWKASVGAGNKDDVKADTKTDNKGGTRLTVRQLTLDNLALTAAGAQTAPSTKTARTGKNGEASATASLASLKKLEVADAQIDLQQQTVLVGKLKLTQPTAHVERDHDRHWMYEAWLKTPATGSAPAAPDTQTVNLKPSKAAMPASTGGPATAKPWSVVLADIALEGGAVQFLDNAPARPVAFEVSAIKVQMKNFALDAKTPSPLTVSARIRAPQGEPGQLDYRGSLGLSPLLAQGSVVATQIPVHLFEPYFADAVNVKLLRADAGFKGDVRFAQSNAAGPQVKVTGDVVVEEFQANSFVGAPSGSSSNDGQEQEELLTWKALSLRGLDLAMAPGVATRVAVRETALTDFFARILINPKGQINLQNLTKSGVPTPDEVATNTVANNSISTRTSEPKDSEKQPVAAATPVAAAVVPLDPLAPIINVGPISLVNGRVFFSDHFVKPNYSANLSDLTGQLSAFSSMPGATIVDMANLELRGRAEGTASLEILGKLNPLAKPLALDIKAKVRDLELPPLSPYSVKYAGHGIERGKLSVDVAYLVKPDGQLEASNNIILNQLTFGEKVEGSESSLPVKLAVALLSDRNGVIDINLPINGSLSDPQFRLGPTIFKVIVNLIVKAITSPFSLLANALGGGGDELSMVGFAPGSAVLSPAATAGLDKVAKALTDRPALKLTVIGTANLELERDAYKRARLEALMATEKRRVAVLGGAAASGASGAIGAVERSVLLKEVYKRSEVTKPRNLVGMAKDIPEADMEALLLANIRVTDEVMRELALQRGVAVKGYLATKQLPPERLFLGAVKAGTMGNEAKAETDTKPDVKADVKTDTKWTPRAELSLAAK